jgi:uncharacterized membrane protein YqaE (UPF0057 family)
MNAAVFVTRIAVGLVLVVAGAAKLRSLSEFRAGVRAYRLVPDWLAGVFALLLPPFEVLLGVGFLAGIWLSWTPTAFLAMVTVFTAAQVINYRSGNRVSCNCFGASPSEPISLATIGRLVILGLLTIGLLVISPGSTQPTSSSTIPLLAIAFGLAATIRLLGVVPIAVDAFRTRATLGPTASSRVSFLHSPPDISFRGDHRPSSVSVPDKAGGS